MIASGSDFNEPLLLREPIPQAEAGPVRRRLGRDSMSPEDRIHDSGLTARLLRTLDL
jgi:hypothetical protein